MLWCFSLFGDLRCEVIIRFFHIGVIVDYHHCLKSVSITVLMPDYKLTNYAPESMDVTMTVDMIIGCRQF